MMSYTTSWDTIRWLCLVNNLRGADGKLQAPMYVLHDEPLVLEEAMQLDASYSELIQHTLRHAAKGVRDLAQQVLEELPHDSNVASEQMPQTLNFGAHGLEQQVLPHDAVHQAEQASVEQVRSAQTELHDSELTLQSQKIRAVRNPPCTVQKPIKQKSTVPHATELEWPTGVEFSTSEQRALRQAMSPLAADAQRAVLLEAAARCKTGIVRRPAAYLMGLIRKALDGDFRLWAGRGARELPGSRSAAVARVKRSPTPERQPQCVSVREASPIALESLKHLRRQVGLKCSA